MNGLTHTHGLSLESLDWCGRNPEELHQERSLLRAGGKEKVLYQQLPNSICRWAFSGRYRVFKQFVSELFQLRYRLPRAPKALPRPPAQCSTAIWMLKAFQFATPIWSWNISLMDVKDQRGL